MRRRRLRDENLPRRINAETNICVDDILRDKYLRRRKFAETKKCETKICETNFCLDEYLPRRIKPPADRMLITQSLDTIPASHVLNHVASLEDLVTNKKSGPVTRAASVRQESDGPASPTEPGV